MANKDLDSMFNGRITSGSNSEKLGLCSRKQVDRYIIGELARNPYAHHITNKSAYMLICGMCTDGSAYVELIGNVIIGRRLSPDGWVPQVTQRVLVRRRSEGLRLVKEFKTFLRRCIMDENFTSSDDSILSFTIRENSEVLVDLNLVASHSNEAPTWMDEDPATVLSYLSLQATGQLKKILCEFSRLINADWTLE